MPSPLVPRGVHLPAAPSRVRLLAAGERGGREFGGRSQRRRHRQPSLRGRFLADSRGTRVGVGVDDVEGGEASDEAAEQGVFPAVGGDQRAAARGGGKERRRREAGEAELGAGGAAGADRAGDAAGGREGGGGEPRAAGRVRSAGGAMRGVSVCTVYLADSVHFTSNVVACLWNKQGNTRELPHSHRTTRRDPSPASARNTTRANSPTDSAQARRRRRVP